MLLLFNQVAAVVVRVGEALVNHLPRHPQLQQRHREHDVNCESVVQKKTLCIYKSYMLYGFHIFLIVYFFVLGYIICSNSTS